MADPIFPRPDNSASNFNQDIDDTQPTRESSEFLLADLVSEENVERLVEGLPDMQNGIGKNLEELATLMNKADITGGDVDDDWYQAEVVGEEAVGGQTPTPDQNVSEDLQKAVGLSAADGDSVRTFPRLEWRDRHPWSLNPESAEDYQERR